MAGKIPYLLEGTAAILLTAGLLNPSALLAAPTSVTKVQDLDFGKVAGGSGSFGTVTIDSSGARSSSGTVMLLNSTCSPARFVINGDAGRPYLLTLPAALTINSGTDQMNVTALTSSIPVTGVLPANGTLSLVVGGTLMVESSQRNSSYSGSLVITVQ